MTRSIVSLLKLEAVRYFMWGLCVKINLGLAGVDMSLAASVVIGVESRVVMVHERNSLN